MINGDYSAWWQFTTAGHHPFEVPDMAWRNSTSVGGERLDRSFGWMGTSGITNSERPHFFKVPGSDKVAWYIHKSDMAFHAGSNDDRCRWVTENVAPDHDQAIVTLSFGALNPENCAPTGGSDSRGFQFVPVLENELFDALPEGSDISIRDPDDPVADGIEFVIPYMLPYRNSFYLPMVRSTAYAPDYQDPDAPSNLTFPISVHLKKWNGSQFVQDGPVISGNLVTDAELGQLHPSATYFDIENLRPFVTDTGEIAIAGPDGHRRQFIQYSNHFCRRVWRVDRCRARLSQSYFAGLAASDPCRRRYSVREVRRT